MDARKTGMKGEYAKFAAKGFGIDMDEYYAKWNCSKCHHLPEVPWRGPA